jgi:hypothetical protein
MTGECVGVTGIMGGVVDGADVGKAYAPDQKDADERGDKRRHGHRRSSCPDDTFPDGRGLM